MLKIQKHHSSRLHIHNSKTEIEMDELHHQIENNTELLKELNTRLPSITINQPFEDIEIQNSSLHSLHDLKKQTQLEIKKFNQSKLKI